MSGMTAQERSDLGRLARSAHWSPPTKRDKRITSYVRASFEAAIYKAIDEMFAGFSRGGEARVLVVHQGEARVMDPNTKDYRIQERKFPHSIVGLYDKNASIDQVIDDVSESVQRWSA